MKKETRKPGRPSSIQNKDDWARKTYMFNKKTLKKLKVYQVNLDDHEDLSVIIDRALKLFLKKG